MPSEAIAEEALRLKQTVDESLAYINGADAQIAFFGGSFTGIERERMILLLKTAYEYVKTSAVSGVRLSTRPDYIDEEILDSLKSYGVTHIELGLQSTDNSVLAATNRGHDRDECFKSAKLITEHGFSLVGQMMVGLPESTIEKEIKTAEDIVAMEATAVRIYPTVVFEGTKLYEQCSEGKYIPISNEEAVARCLACLKIFRRAGVDILRIGLHSSEELSIAPFGANHPAIGELVYGEEAYNAIVEQIGDADTENNELVIYAPEKSVSIVAGLNGRNKRRLYEEFGFKRIKIIKNGVNEPIKVSIKAEE